MLKKLITIITVALAFNLFSADKYAVLIAGDYNPTNVPADQLWNEGQGDYSEFWNDLYLQWEMLYQKGYAKENITVIFSDGQDMWQDDPSIATRYRAVNAIPENEDETITNYSATKGNLTTAVNALKSKMGQEDFLYVWAMSHGGSPTQSSLYFNDGEMTDTEFAELFNTVTANKKVFVINANYAQGFLDKFTGENVRVEVSSQDSKSHRADDMTKEGAYIPFLENEEINGKIYYHGELTLHKYISSMMQTQYGSTTYNGIDLQSVDINNDNRITFDESYNWVVEHQSDLLNNTYPDFYDSGETISSFNFPTGSYSSLEYPTLVFNTFGTTASSAYANGPSKKGIIGIAEDLSVGNEDYPVSLSLNSNSIATILDDHTGIYPISCRHC